MKCISIFIPIFIFIFIIFVIYYYDDNHNLKKLEPLNNNNIPIPIIGEIHDEKIGLQSIPNFLTYYECNHLIYLAINNFSRSTIINGNSDEYDKNRTSSSYYIPKSYDEIVKKIENKVSLLINMPITNIERLQVVRYKNGEEFKPHFDWFHEPYRSKINNQRIYTFFVYLNDVEQKGETVFPNINKSFKPVKGTSLFWKNCESINLCYDEALHQGKAPKNQEKYGLNIWVNFNKLN